MILLRGVRTLNTTPGGLLVLANQPFRSPATDPDNPGLLCPAAAATTGFSANCFRAEPTTAYVFDSNGVARRPNFGTFRTNIGQTPFVTVGGDGRNPNTESGQQTRLPFDEAYRFQTGLNFRLSDSVQLFAEAKYVARTAWPKGRPSSTTSEFRRSEPAPRPAPASPISSRATPLSTSVWTTPTCPRRFRPRSRTIGGR